MESYSRPGFRYVSLALQLMQILCIVKCQNILLQTIIIDMLFSVRRAKGLNIKGKNGTNDAFVTIGLGKEKFQTSVKEKSETPEWLEQCEL